MAAQELHQSYEQGKSIADLIRDTGLGEKTIRNALQRTNTKKRTKSQAHLLFYKTQKGQEKALRHSEKMKRYSVNDSFFIKPLNPISAYVLGFWLADGHIEKRNPHVFSISQMEKEILLKIKNALNSTHPIHAQRNKGFRLTITSAQICNSIMKMCPFLHKGIKSSVAEYPSLPANLDSHFIRGIFDGDGGLWEKDGQLQFSITGTAKLNKIIRKKLITNCHASKTKIILRGKELRFSQLSYSGNKQVPRILNWLYKDAEIFIERKREFFRKFTEKRLNMVDY
jgi:hypothetical protein